MHQAEQQFPLLGKLGFGASAPAATAPASALLSLKTENLPKAFDALPTMRHSTWTSKRVSEWLTGMGLREYADIFAQHRITGDLLEVLTEEHLRELGVHVVGHRLVILRELGNLKRRAFDRERHAVLWKGDEVLHTAGPMQWLRDHLLCRPLCHDPDRYKVTFHGIHIETTENKDNRCAWSRGKTTRTIELTSIVGVSALHSADCLSCGCTADEVTIDINRELGLPELTPLKVEHGEGQRVAQLIRSAVDEAQGLAMPTSPGGKGPNGQSMSRDASRASEMLRA